MTIRDYIKKYYPDSYGIVDIVTEFNFVRSLMIKDNSLDEWICETEAREKRDITVEEEYDYVLNILFECVERARDLSCSIKEAYEDIMY